MPRRCMKNTWRDNKKRLPLGDRVTGEKRFHFQGAFSPHCCFCAHHTLYPCQEKIHFPLISLIYRIRHILYFNHKTRRARSRGGFYTFEEVDSVENAAAGSLESV